MKSGEFMAVWTLEEAKSKLKLWLSAEDAVATGQSYQIGSRRLDRANLYQIREQIKMWKSEVEKLEASSLGRRGARVIRVVPRDL